LPCTMTAHTLPVAGLAERRDSAGTDQAENSPSG